MFARRCLCLARDTTEADVERYEFGSDGTFWEILRPCPIPSHAANRQVNVVWHPSFADRERNKAAATTAAAPIESE